MNNSFAPEPVEAQGSRLEVHPFFQHPHILQGPVWCINSFCCHKRNGSNSLMPRNTGIQGRSACFGDWSQVIPQRSWSWTISGKSPLNHHWIEKLEGWFTLKIAAASTVLSKRHVATVKQLAWRLKIVLTTGSPKSIHAALWTPCFCWLYVLSSIASLEYINCNNWLRISEAQTAVTKAVPGRVCTWRPPPRHQTFPPSQQHVVKTRRLDCEHFNRMSWRTTIFCAKERESWRTKACASLIYLFSDSGSHWISSTSIQNQFRVKLAWHQSKIHQTSQTRLPFLASYL